MTGSFGKPDATGRSSGKLTGSDRKWRSPPKGEPWAWLTRELLCSPAWRAQGPNWRRLIDFLLIEHMNHAGTENGRLMATYNQLSEYGLSRRLVSEAVREAEFLGLIRVNHGGRLADSNQPSTYRLTFYAGRDGSPATNEWKGKTAEVIKEWKRDQAAQKKRAKERRKKQNSSATSRTTVVQLSELRTAQTGQSQ